MKLLALVTLCVIGLLCNAADDVFEADDAILENGPKVNIEQLHSTKKATKTANSSDLTFSALLYTPEDNDEKASKFYSTVVENLKKYGEKLRTLQLYGGHTYYPKKSTPEEVKNEIEYVRDHLQALLSALKDAKVVLRSNVFTIVMVVDEKTQKASDFEKTLVQVFGKDSVVDDTNEDGLELLFDMEGAFVHLYWVFINQLDQVAKTKLPYGRSPYAKSIDEYLEPIYDKLEEQSKKRIHNNASNLFTPGVKRLNRAGELHLEEFYNEKYADSQIKDTSASETLRQLGLSLGVPLQDSEDVTPAAFYKQAAANLKKRAPKLERVRLDGGYAFNPEKSEKGDIEKEIKYFKETLSSALKALKNEDIEVVGVRMKVYWLSTQKSATESEYPKFLKKAFNFEPTKADIESGKVLMTFKIDGIECDVELNFFETAPATLAKGRTAFYQALDAEEKADDANSEKSETKKD